MTVDIASYDRSRGPVFDEISQLIPAVAASEAAYAGEDVQSGVVVRDGNPASRLRLINVSGSTSPVVTQWRAYLNAFGGWEGWQYVDIAHNFAAPRFTSHPRYGARLNVDLLVTCGGESRRVASESVAWGGGAPWLHLQSVTPGSLAAHMESKVSGTMGSTPYNASTKGVWTSNNYNALAWSGQRNPNNPLFGVVDTTAFSAAVQGRDKRFPYTLISPRHVIVASHVKVANGSQLVFVDNTGAPHVAVVTAHVAVESMPDTQVGYLDRAIPSSVTPVAFLPPGYHEKIPVMEWKIFRKSNIIPGLRVFSRFCMRDGVEKYGWVGMGQNSRTQVNSEGFSVDITQYIDVTHTLDSKGLGVDMTPGTSFADYAVGGDSGGQVFTQVGTETVLLTSWFGYIGGNPGRLQAIGGGYSGSTGLIAAAMNMVKPPSDTTIYSPKEVDISGFPTLINAVPSRPGNFGGIWHYPLSETLNEYPPL